MSAEDEHAVGDLGPGGEHEPFRISIRAGTSGRDFTASMPASARSASKDAVNCRARCADQELEGRGAVAQVHQEVADLLGGPRPVWMGRDPEDVHVAGADPDDEQAVQALEGDCAV